MRILILCDFKVSGSTPALQAPYSPLRNKTKWADISDGDLTLRITSITSSEVFSELWDIIIVYNALESYLANRFDIKGRPWVCCASFCFEDTHTFYNSTIPVADMGLDAIFTNCRPFIERAAPHIPTLFVWPPIGKFESGSSCFQNYKIGAYIPEVMDRDLSLVELCYALLKSRGLKDNIGIFSVNPNVVKRAFPNATFTEAVTYGVAPYSHFNVYIPVPRISDILFGVIDTEILSAVESGCFPLVIRHGKFPQLYQWINPVFDSVSRLEDALISICEGGLFDHSVEMGMDLGTIDDDFIDVVKAAYKRKKANAAT